MKAWLLILLFAFAPLTLQAREAAPLAQDEATEQRLVEISSELRCLVCQNESLADSSADLAKDLREEVFEQMNQGKSDIEIKQYLTARYGDFVLYNPPLRGGTVLLWFGPLLVLLIGAGIVYRIVRRRAKVTPATPSAASSEEDW